MHSKITILIVLLNFNCYAQKDAIEFNDMIFYSGINNSQSELFHCARFKRNRNCEKYYAKFKKLNLEKYIIEENGDTSKLTMMTESIVNLVQDDKMDLFLATAIYLNENNCSTKKLFDDMLEVSIGFDSLNLVAHYELAKLRFEGGYVGLSCFLLDRISQVYASNLQIKSLQEQIKNKYGDDTYDKSMTYKVYLNLNPHYIEN